MRKARSAISHGIYALIVIALVITVGFGVYLNDTFNTRTSTSSLTHSSSGNLTSYTSTITTTAQTVSNLSAIKLELAVASNGSLGSIMINVEDYNTLGTMDTVNSTNQWTTNQSSLFYPCPDSWPPNNPVNLAMFQGYYDSNNYTSGHALLLQNPNTGYSCTMTAVVGNTTQV